MMALDLPTLSRPLLLGALVALAACSSQPPPSLSSSPSPLPSDGFGDGTFSVAIVVPAGPLRAGEPIDLRARVMYQGPAASILVTGTDAGLVAFDFRQESGQLQMLAGSRLMCSASSTLARDAPVDIRPLTMAGWSSDDPDRAFYQAWVADPVVRLPAGTWRITAHVQIFEGPTCMGEPNPHRFVLEKTIVVEG